MRLRARLEPSPQLAEFYREFNREWFGGRLPADTRLYWMPARMANRSGHLAEVWGTRKQHRPITNFKISVSNRIRFSSRLVVRVLLHEMAHISTGLGAQHGPRWQREMLRLAKAGAFARLW
jgi:hypothetical protein